MFKASLLLLVASLKLVSPGAVTGGVTLFYLKKWWPFLTLSYRLPSPLAHSPPFQVTICSVNQIQLQ